MYEITIENNGISQKIHEKSPDSPCRLSAGKLVEEINQIPSFSFTVSAGNPCYSNGLNDRKTLVKIVNTITKETEFEGVLLTHETSMSSAGKLQKTAVCEGLLGYLCDTIQPYRHYEDATVSQFLFSLLENHNAQTSADKRIFLGECNFGDDHKNSKTTAYRNTLEEIKVNLIDRIGGEMRVRRVEGKLVLDFLRQCGEKSDLTVELAKNMKSLEVKNDSTDVVTRLIPLGVRLGDGESAERLTIAEINEDKPYIDDENAVEKYGIIVGTAVFDDITRAENLIEAGRKYLENNNRIKKYYSAEVPDLSIIDGSRKNLRCGNVYRFKNSFMGLDENLRLKKRTVDIYKPFAPIVEIGDKSEKITDVAIRTNNIFEYELPEQKSEMMAMAKAIATSLIANATTGFVVIRPDEVLIMDTDSVETATKVWRWNSGGLGYSSTGYSGEYGLAMTMDGQIVADYITAGTLRGCEILNGDGTFHVDETGKVTAENIEITGGSINIQTGNENFDVISLSQGDCRSGLSPTGLVVRNAQTKKMISVNVNGIYAYNDYDKIPEHTFSVSYQTGEINTSGGVFAGGNISAKDIHGDVLRSEGDVKAGGNITGHEIYADNLHFKMDNGYQYSLRTYLNYLEDRLNSL